MHPDRGTGIFIGIADDIADCLCEPAAVNADHAVRDAGFLHEHARVMCGNEIMQDGRVFIAAADIHFTQIIQREDQQIIDKIIDLYGFLMDFADRFDGVRILELNHQQLTDDLNSGDRCFQIVAE